MVLIIKKYEGDNLQVKRDYCLEDVLKLYNTHITPNRNGEKKSKKRILESTEYILKSLELPYKKIDENIFFNNKVFSILEEFYINESHYLKGELEVVNFNDALVMFNNNISRGTYRVQGGSDYITERDIRRRQNWLNFIKMIPIKFYSRTFYFSIWDVENFIDSIVNTTDMMRILVEQFKRRVSLQSLHRILKEFYDEYKIDFLGQSNYYPRKIVRDVSSRFLFTNELYYTVKEVSKELGLSEGTIQNRINETKLFPGTIKINGYHQIPKNSVNKWSVFINEHTSLYDFISILLKSKGVKVKKPLTDDFGLIHFYNFLIEQNNSLKIDYIEGKNTPFYNVPRFVKNKDLPKFEILFEEYWEKKSLIKDEGRVGTFKIAVKNLENDKAKITMKEFFEFCTFRISKYKQTTTPSLIEFYKILVKLNKELFYYNDGEIEKLLVKIKQKSKNKSAIQVFCMFLSLIQKKYNCKYTNIYKYNKNEQSEKEYDVFPYNQEQFFRFGFLIINSTHTWYEEYLNKAVSKRLYSSIWLYGLLHYVCSWRSVDMIKKIPFPNLNMSGREFLKLVQENKFTEDMANKIVNEVEMRIRYLNLKPAKTEKHDPPNLVFEIPESIKFRLGMLIGLCEAHRQISDGNYLLVTEVKNKKEQINFFGDEFLGIFNGDGLNNTRANKTFQTLIAQKAEEEEFGTGYIIASLARSHKCTSEDKSNTTAIYLKYYNNLTQSDILLKELFERGVCSFVPYMILKIIEGEEKVEKIDYGQQTKLVKEIINFYPYDAEMLMLTFEDLLEKAKDDAYSLIRYFSIQEFNDDTSNPNKAIYRFLKKIAFGSAPAKEKNLNCISVAKGVGCIFPSRTTCIGCGQEIYLKSSLFLIGQRMREMIFRENESKTIAEKNKYKLFIEQVFKPLLIEIMIVLRDCYGVEDVSEYRDMIFGITNSLLEGE